MIITPESIAKFVERETHTAWDYAGHDAISFKAGANSLAPALLLAVEALKQANDDNEDRYLYGQRWKIKEDIEKALAEIEKMLGVETKKWGKRE